MREKTNRNCYFCGKPYFACDSSIKLGSWKASCCSPEHFQAWQIALSLQSGNMTSSEAKEALKRINIKPSMASDVVGAKMIFDAAFAQPVETAVEPATEQIETDIAPVAKRPYVRKTKAEDEE